MLASGIIVAYGYAMELFMAWYSGNTYEGFTAWNRIVGPYWPAYWALILCNVVIPQLLWFKRVRTKVPVLFVLSLTVNLGMWLERFVIVVTSLHRDFLPSSWGMYTATRWDWAVFVGSISRCGGACAQGRLSVHGRLRAIPCGGAGRSAEVSPHPSAADHADWRHRRRLGRIFHAVLDCRDQLSPEHRRPAAA